MDLNDRIAARRAELTRTQETAAQAAKDQMEALVDRAIDSGSSDNMEAGSEEAVLHARLVERVQTETKPYALIPTEMDKLLIRRASKLWTKEEIGLAVFLGMVTVLLIQESVLYAMLSFSITVGYVMIKNEKYKREIKDRIINSQPD